VTSVHSIDVVALINPSTSIAAPGKQIRQKICWHFLPSLQPGSDYI